MKHGQLAPTKRQEVDALTLKNKLGTRYNGSRLATKAKHKPGDGKYR